MKIWFGFIAFYCIFAFACVPTQQSVRSASDGFLIWGYVGKGTKTAAPGENVRLVDGETKKTLDIVRSNFMGKYVFKGLAPGYYKITVAKIAIPVMVKKQDVRLDIDLNNPTGAMDYVGAGMKDLAKELEKASQGSGQAASPEGDRNLMAKITGSYMSFSGGSYGSSTNWLNLCPSGNFSFSSESAYGGGSTDQYGNETMNWGSASQSADSGKWSITGTKMKATLHLNYNNGKRSDLSFVDCSRESGGCVYINGRKYGWSAPNCK